MLADAGYGVDTAFRTGLAEMGLPYIVGIQSSTSLWPPGIVTVCRPKPGAAAGGRPRSCDRNPEHKPVSAKELAQTLPESAWHTVTWREGTKASLTSRFAAVRVRPAHRDYWRSAPRPEEWFLIEWPAGESEPTKYWLSTLPQDTPLGDLVDQAKLRWRIERDYQELKQEIGLGHFEGRGWRGFHHHATLSSQPTGSWSPSGADSPLRATLQRSSKRLRYPKVIDPAAPPLRPERHVVNSIATIRVNSPTPSHSASHDVPVANSTS